MEKINLSTSKPPLTVVVIARNEEQMIANCLDTLRWAKEVIVLDTGSEDRTKEIAKHSGAKVIEAEGSNFGQWRTEVLKNVSTPWVLYIDADERVTPKLSKAIIGRLNRDDYDAFSIERNNIHYGKWMQFGGWNNDRLLRLFKKEKLKGWKGKVHESAEIIGRIGQIEEPLVHLTHRSLFDGLRKSIEWTEIEAELLYQSDHPKVGPLRIMKVVVFDLLKRLFFKRAWKDGAEGMIEAMVQAMNRFLVYARLWEKQQQPPLEKRYDRIETQIQKLWKEK